MRLIRGTGVMLRAAILLTGLGLGFAPGQALGQDGGDLDALGRQIETSNQELANLRQEIHRHREHINALATEQQDAEKELQSLVREMGLVKELLAGLNQREEMLQQQSDSLRARLTSYEQDYRRQQEQLARRIRALYKHGPQRDLELILTADSFSSLVIRLKFTTLMGQLDQQMMAQIRQDGLKVLDAQSRLREALAGIWEAREEATQERRRLEEMDQERRAVLADLEQERQDVESILSRLKNREQTLRNVLEGLEQQRRTSAPTIPGLGDFTHLAGTLDWPVAGEVLRGFGRSVHPEFKTVTLNNGLNIAAPLGTPVYAVADGSVEFSDYLPGFGVCVILDHGEGYYSLYAHLERVFVSPGGRVNRNEILAEVGGAEQEGGSQLYFEIRQGKTPLDPIQWLKPRGR